MPPSAILEPGAWPPVMPLGRFGLRPLRIGDEDPLLANWSDPRVTEHTSIPPIDGVAARRLIERYIADYASASSCRWALVDERDILVGTCGFSNWSVPHSHAELAYDLAPALWHMGLMGTAVGAVVSWAFGAGGLNRVHAFILDSNQRSIRLLERLGFRREGTLAQYRFVRGVPRDFHLYALVKQDPARGPGTAQPTGEANGGPHPHCLLRTSSMVD